MSLWGTYGDPSAPDFAESLRNVAGSYGAFCRAAERLPWFEIEEWHAYWRGAYPVGATLDAYRFPPGYLQENSVPAYVRGILSGIGFWEEWSRDFWDVPQAERARWLNLGRSLYESYAVVREIRFVKRDWAYLAGEIAHFGGENAADSQRKFDLQHLQGAEVLEIGGSGPGDFVYLAVKDSRMLLVSCGFWD